MELRRESGYVPEILEIEILVPSPDSERNYLESGKMEVSEDDFNKPISSVAGLLPRFGFVTFETLCLRAGWDRVRSVCTSDVVFVLFWRAQIMVCFFFEKSFVSFLF